MIDWRIMTATVGIGALVGLAGGWLVWGASSLPSATVASLLSERCVPYVDGEDPDVADLETFWMGAGQGYVVPGTAIAVQFHDRGERRSCGITDVLSPWSAMQRDAVFEVVERFATFQVAPMNKGDMVKEELTAEGVGDPQIVWRRADVAEGYYVMFIRHRFPEDLRPTQVSFGRSAFLRPARQVEGSDA